MKILYIAPENVSGTLALFKREHERRGDTCRFVTFWHSRWDFPDDICLHLPFMPDRAWVRGLRRLTRLNPLAPHDAAAAQRNLWWNPNPLVRALFTLRDYALAPRISAAIRRYHLDEFDIYHLDGGLDFTRDARFIRTMAARGKGIVCFYHGSDLRTRGIVPAVDEVTALRLTSEWDLVELDPRLRYLYLPFDTSLFNERPYAFHHPIRICHAARNPYKGTALIQTVVARLARRFPVELVLLRDVPHHIALQTKAECDIFVDQLTNAGGWGYGMSSVEALAIGMPVVTNIPPPMEARLGSHPFVQATPDTLEIVIEELLRNEQRCAELAAAGRAWVRERHDVQRVADQLYAYYADAGWITRT